MRLTARPRHREPTRKIVDHARKEPGFGRAEQEAHDVKLHRGAHKHHACGEQSPGNHDPCYPLRGAVAPQHETERHFEHRVGEEEKTGPQTVDRCAEFQVSIHLERRETDVHPIDIGHEISQ